jgi:UDP-N-acetyl-D-mannosaminuronate dehydrogenase
MPLAPDHATAHNRTFEDACRAVTAAVTRELSARCRLLGVTTFEMRSDEPGPAEVDPAWVARLVDLAGAVTTAGPATLVRRVADALNFIGKPINGSRLFVIGVGDSAHGPWLALLEMLIQRGARVEYHDPSVPALPALPNYPRLRLVSRAVAPDALAAVDAVVVRTNVPAGQLAVVRKHAPLIIDARVADALSA